MKYASFKKRVLAAFVDCVFISIIVIIISFQLLTNYWKESVNQQMAPFVVITMLITPFSTIANLINYPIAYGNTIPYYSLFVVSFFIEVIYYTIQEICKSRGTIGFNVCSIEIAYTGTKNYLLNIILRNILKTISRYLYGIPLLTMFLSRKKQTIYDIITTAIVVEKQ